MGDRRRRTASRFARSRSTWIHWWSPVTSAKASIASCVTSCQSDVPRSSPSACLSSVESGDRAHGRGPYPPRAMPQPLLLADTPHLLYRAFFALPDTITGADGRPVNALLGSVNQLLWCVERYEPRAVVCCFGQESATYRTELYPPYHAHRPPMPDDAGRPVGARAGALRGARLDGDGARRPRGRRPDVRLRARRRSPPAGARMILTGDRDMFQCAGDGDHDPAPARAPGGPGRDGRRRGARSATASRRRSCRTSSRCAATRRTGCRAPRGSARRPRPTCCAATARSRRRSRARSARSRPCAAR